MKTAILFSGQGAQYPGMMKDLYDTETAAKEVFDCADRTLGRKISEICFEGTQEDLNLTHNTQPCMLAGDLAAAMVLKSHGISADAAAGFSLGEYAALVFAGVLTAEDAFRIIQIRADAMQEACAPGEGAMAAFIGSEAAKVEEICSLVKDGYVVPANYNSPVQTVVSGSAAGVEEALRIAEQNGLKCIRLAVSAPFHCEMMKSAAMRLKEEFQTISFRNALMPVYMNVNASPAMEGGVFADLLVRQAMSPVLWVQTLESMQKDGIDTFIECGAGKTLSGLVKKTLKGVRVSRIENTKTLQDTLKVFADAD